MKPNTYLNAATRPYRRGSPETPIVIATRAIDTIEPSFIRLGQSAPDGMSRHHSVRELGYAVTYRVGRETRHASATAEGLKAAGLPVPPMPTAAPSMRP